MQTKPRGVLDRWCIRNYTDAGVCGGRGRLSPPSTILIQAPATHGSGSSVSCTSSGCHSESARGINSLAVKAISAMEPHNYKLKNDRVLLIRQAAVEDASAVLDYIHEISGESDFLTFGPGEFELTEPEEQAFIRQCLVSDNQLFLLGVIDDTIVATLIFSAGRRPRVRHSGECSMSVRKRHWGLGIGSLMLDTLIDWARHTQIVKKINLRVRTDNQRAILLYERKGFAKEGTIRKAIFLGGKYFDHHWMGLEL